MKKSAFKFSSFQEPTLSPFEKLFNIFKELIIHTSGDFDEAIEWLRELDKEYKLTDENYTIDDFVNDLLKKGYIRKEISDNPNKANPAQLLNFVTNTNSVKHMIANSPANQTSSSESNVHNDPLATIFPVNKEAGEEKPKNFLALPTNSPIKFEGDEQAKV